MPFKNRLLDLLLGKTAILNAVLVTQSLLQSAVLMQSSAFLFSCRLFQKYKNDEKDGTIGPLETFNSGNPGLVVMGVQKVGGSNPGGVYWMDIFLINLL